MQQKERISSSITHPDDHNDEQPKWVELIKMKYIIISFFLTFSQLSFGQNAVINEFSTDPSMHDGSGGEFIEMYCPAGGGDCDISCWVVSDGQGIVTIPDNTIIAESGFYLIAHAPSFNCASCDFFDIPIDLNTATCGCLNGGSYGYGIDGNPALVLGQSGNAGEMMLLYNDVGTLKESWMFDNASSTSYPSGSIINGSILGTCPAKDITTLAASSNLLVNVGGIHLGCNTSYLRDPDGSATWIEDNHPTPGATNANSGGNAYNYQYRIDEDTWITIPKTSGTNEDDYTASMCSGDSIEFRIVIENYQNALLSVFDASGKYGSYYKSPVLGIVEWANVSGLGVLDGDLLTLQSNKEAMLNNSTNSYVLQWSDYKNGLGSFSLTSTNECYERMNFTLDKNQNIGSATVSCSDAINGLSSTAIYPSDVDGYGSDLFFDLYDDIGDQSNLVSSNQTGLFSLSLADAATVAYYVVVRNQCNEIVAMNNSAFCLASPLCPQITASSFVKNGNACGLETTVAHFEDFEGPSGVGYAASGVFSDSTNDYFDLIGDVPDPTGVPPYTGANGTQFWAAEDTQDGGNPNATGISTISITGISIAGLSSLQFSGLFAAGSSSAFDDADYLHISIQIDGGGYSLLGAFEGAGGFNTALLLDTDFNGAGDGTVLGVDFQNISLPISGSGALLDIQFDVFMSAGDEAVAIDSISITGEMNSTCLACPEDTLTFSVEGINLPQGGRINWFYDTNSNFDPYNGDGTYIGFTPIPINSECSSSTVVFNELNYRPATNNGTNPDAGETIELIGPPGMDLSCYVLTDGDWTITFPEGSIIPADGLFTIGNDNVYGAGFFDLDAENCGCYTDGPGGDGLLILTDGGEYISLFNSAGTFVQGLIYGSPSAGNTPPSGSNSAGGFISTIGSSGCPASITVPGAASFETAGSVGTNGTTLIRSPDGDGDWSTQTGGSINNCNVPNAPDEAPDFDYVIPQEACNETRVYQGIINPHPNTPACLNSDVSAFTEEFTVEIQCPIATMGGLFEVCETSAPVSLPVDISGISSPQGVTFIYTNNGALDTLVSDLVNGTFLFNANSTGIYSGVSIIPDLGCNATIDGSITVNIIPTPDAPSIPDPILVCEGDTVLLTASGASTFEWALTNDFSTIENTGTDFSVAVPNVVFVRSVNQNDLSTLSCQGATATSTINVEECSIILLTIELISFDVELIDKKVRLDWQTASEINNDYFTIERSQNVLDWHEIDKINGAGNSSSWLNYSSLDNEPFIGVSYYRLKQTDFDGEFSYSFIRSINIDRFENARIEIFPNPFYNQITILGSSAELKVIIIYNALGQNVTQLTEQIVKNETLLVVDLSRLNSGIYYVKTKTTAHKVSKQ
ncbi:MAG: hypothetical protein ACI9RU_001735 [Litorivivens sp.]|jgi:hypothetical protein